MGTRQVRVEYTGTTSFDIDESAIADDLPPDPTDEQIVAAIGRDIDSYMEHGSNVAPIEHSVEYDRDELIESVRAEIERRRIDAADNGEV